MIHLAKKLTIVNWYMRELKQVKWPKWQKKKK